LAALDAAQQLAAAHGDAPLLVIAGAGTGKTLTLAARVAHLVMQGADTERMLLLTFSRRAAPRRNWNAAAAVCCTPRSACAPRSPHPACPGLAPSTRSVRACCACMPRRSALAQGSPCTTEATPRT